MSARISRFSFSRVSIQQRLPLLICALLLSAIVLFSLATYYGLKKAALAIGWERLDALTGQLGTMLEQSSDVVTASLRASAAQPAIKQYLSGDRESRRKALAVLDKLRKDSTWVLMELLDSNKTPVLRSAKSSADIKLNCNDAISFTKVTPGGARIGKIYREGGVMYYPAVAGVAGGGHALGYIVCWQRLHATPKAVEQLSTLMGTGATLYIGNTDGSLWTDMVRPVAAPPFKIQNLRGPVEYADPNGNQMMAKLRPVANTSWLVLVEFSKQTVLEGVKRFVSWIAIIGALLIAVGILAAWMMSRNITRPLNQLTTAASAISQGDYSNPVYIDAYPADEIGKLAGAFHIMAASVQQTQQDLERQVKQRTAQLSEEVRLRKVSEEMLRLSRQRYLMLVEEVKDYAIIMLDADGKILLWNKGAEKIKGYHEEEILGKPSSLFYTPEDTRRNKPGQLLQKAAKEGRAEDIGWRVRKDGSKFWADVVLTAIYNDKKLMGFAKITRDITERKKLEEEQRITNARLEERVKEVAARTMQLEAANKELDAFSYSVSHDLRSPLRAISGYSIILREDYEEKLDKEGSRIIANIISNVKMMGQLIDDLLAFSRLGKKEMDKTQVNMLLLVTNVADDLLKDEPEGKYKISISPLPPALADPVMIKQVWINLLSNAIKYSSKKMHPEITVGYQDDEAGTTYFVKDNGAGFNMAYSSKLFGVFQRLHSQEEFSGTGVGLALVKRIIGKHNGKVWAEAAENEGAAFYFSLLNYE